MTTTRAIQVAGLPESHGDDSASRGVNSKRRRGSLLALRGSTMFERADA
jgi:hypothetical protein